MAEKPTYEELEKRVQELEKIESDFKSSKEALQEKESLFNLLYEKAPLGYQSLDENGCFIIVNKTWLDTLGYAKEEVIGKSFEDFLHPDWRDHFKENFPKFKAIGEILGVEFEMVKKNGDLILVSFTGKISRDEKGNFEQTHCVFHDISELKQAEQALKSNYALLQIAGETALFGGWSVDLENNICTWSDAVADIHDVPRGYTPPVQEGINFYAPEWREKITQVFNACAKEGIPYDEELEILTQKGNRIWVRTAGKAVKNEKGKIIKVQGSFQDITDKKQAEESLRESEEKFRTIVDQAADMLIVHDMEGRIIDVNKASVKGYGYSRKELLSMKVVDLDPDYIKRDNSGRFWDRFGMNEPYRFEARQRRKDGTIFSVEVTVTKLMVNEQVVIMGLCRDISDRRKAEKEKEKEAERDFSAGQGS